MSDFANKLANMPEEKRLYQLQACIAHQKESGYMDRAKKILLEFDFLQTKLDVIGVNALLSDFEGLTSDETLRLLENAISNSAHTEKNEFAEQLVGRLGIDADDYLSLAPLLEQAMAFDRHPVLMPQLPTLTQAGGPLVRIIPLENEGRALALTDDGEHLVVADGNQVKIFAWRTNELLTAFTQHSDRVNAVTVQGKVAFSASDDKTVKVWNWQTGELITNFTQHESKVRTVTVQNEMVFSTGPHDTIKIWNWRNGKLILDSSRLNNDYSTLPTSPMAVQGNVIISTERIGFKVKAWHWNTRALITYFTQHSSGITAIAMQDKIAITASRGNQIAWQSVIDVAVKVWNWKTGRLITDFTQHTDTVHAMAIQGDIVFSADGTVGRGTVKVWNWRTGELITDFTQHSWTVNAVTVSDHLAFSASDDKTVKIWDWRSSEPITAFAQHTDEINAVAVRGETIFSTSHDNTMKVWNWRTGELITDFNQYSSGAGSVAVQDNIMCSTFRGKVKVWNWQTGEMIAEFAQHSSAIHKVVIQGEYAFSASADQTVKIWNWRTGELFANYAHYSSPVTAVAVQGDIAVIGYGLVGGGVEVRKWQEGGEPIRVFSQHTSLIQSVAIQGAVVISASNDRTVKVWHWATGEIITNFTQHADRVNEVIILGELVFSASNDHTVKVWRWRTSEVLTTFTADTGLTHLDFDPQQRIVVAGDVKGHVHVLQVVGLDHLLFPEGKMV